MSPTPATPPPSPSYGAGNVPKPIGTKVSRWAADPFARGSYSSLWVHSTDQEWYDLAAPESDALYFAGEHTNYDGRYQSLDGAYNSGTREAERIAARPWNNGGAGGVDQVSKWANPHQYNTGWSPSEPASGAYAQAAAGKYGADTKNDADKGLYKESKAGKEREE